MLLLELCPCALFLLACWRGHSGPPWFLPGAATSDRSQPHPHPPLRQPALGLIFAIPALPAVWLQLESSHESRAQAWWNPGEGLEALGEEDCSWIWGAEKLRKAWGVRQQSWVLALEAWAGVLLRVELCCSPAGRRFPTSCPRSPLFLPAISPEESHSLASRNIV